MEVFRLYVTLDDGQLHTKAVMHDELTLGVIEGVLAELAETIELIKEKALTKPTARDRARELGWRM